MHSSKTLTAIICDDEAPMRAQLRSALQKVWPELIILAEAVNGNEAISFANLHKPDIIFLDIRMPGQSGIEAAHKLHKNCHIVFVTAYDQYAIQAFNQGAIDYLLKPIDLERLGLTRTRLCSRISEKPADISELITQLVGKLDSKKPTYLNWIQATVGKSLRMISTKDILFFQADDKYTKVQTEHAQMLIRKSLKELADELDPDEFWRIHRSTLVRVDAITEITRDIRGRHVLHLRQFEERLEVSRNYTHLFQQM